MPPDAAELKRRITEASETAAGALELALELAQDDTYDYLFQAIRTLGRAGRAVREPNKLEMTI